MSEQSSQKGNNKTPTSTPTTTIDNSRPIVYNQRQRFKDFYLHWNEISEEKFLWKRKTVDHYYYHYYDDYDDDVDDKYHFLVAVVVVVCLFLQPFPVCVLCIFCVCVCLVCHKKKQTMVKQMNVQCSFLQPRRFFSSMSITVIYLLNKRIILLK